MCRKAPPRGEPAAVQRKCWVAVGAGTCRPEGHHHVLSCMSGTLRTGGARSAQPTVRTSHTTMGNHDMAAANRCVKRHEDFMTNELREKINRLWDAAVDVQHPGSGGYKYPDEIVSSQTNIPKHIVIDARRGYVRRPAKTEASPHRQVSKTRYAWSTGNFQKILISLPRLSFLEGVAA